MGLRTWLGLKKPKVPKNIPVLCIPTGDYEAYRNTQNAGNANKIDLIYVREPNIARLAAYVQRRIGNNPRILCHGTRNGAELRYFKNSLPEATVLGTEIADTATQFPGTIQWDFHDLKDEWIGAWDVIYSNSWDHAFDPERAFKNWMRALSKDGVLLLEHTREHTPQYATELDPFGATLSGLIEMLSDIGRPQWGVIQVLSDLPDRARDERIVVVGSCRGRAD